jgi:hypothetical protein
VKLNINGKEAPEVISFDCAILLQLKSGAKLAESGLPCSFRRRIIGLPLENLALNQVLKTRAYASAWHISGFKEFPLKRHVYCIGGLIYITQPADITAFADEMHRFFNNSRAGNRRHPYKIKKMTE